ncbi:MAG: hypothetical protein AAGL98_07640, partial [Planctomycetota bacterium]
MKWWLAIGPCCFWLVSHQTVGQTLEVRDSVAFKAPAETDGPPTNTLAALAWDAQTFEAQVIETPAEDYDAQVRFASPRPGGDAGVDTVVLRWYRPAPGSGRPSDEARNVHAPETRETSPSQISVPGAVAVPGAVLVVHTLHPDLPVATFLARGLRTKGVHAFVIEMPGYASRRATPRRMTGVTTLIRGTQAVTDCRRALDVIRTLGAPGGVAEQSPGGGFDGQRVAIQGTSLGSFVACAAAAIDGAFAPTFLFLSGGDGMSILRDGQKDAFHVRGALKHYGYEDDALRDLMNPIEPLRIANRENPK